MGMPDRRVLSKIISEVSALSHMGNKVFAFEQLTLTYLCDKMRKNAGGNPE